MNSDVSTCTTDQIVSAVKGLKYNDLLQLAGLIQQQITSAEETAAHVLAQANIEEFAAKFNIRLDPNTQGVISRPIPPLNAKVKVDAQGVYHNTETGRKWIPAHGRPPKWAQAYRKVYGGR